MIYQSTVDPAAHKAYVPLAGATLQHFAGRFLARGPATVALQNGTPERTVIIEFDNKDEALAWWHSPMYQKALKVLGSVDREVRLVEGLE
jgi:uncharacterized protein (DUF1330 family)